MEQKRREVKEIKMTMKKIMKIITASLLALMFICNTTNKISFAAETAAIVESYTEEDNVVLYVSGITGKVQEISYQMGNTLCEVSEYQTIQQMDDPIYTLIVWDNSISVMSSYEERIKEILLDIVASRAPGEKFSVVTLEKDITVLSDYTSEYSVLKQTINGVKKEDKSVQIIENLYNCLENFNDMEDCCFKRIILVSDGGEEEGMGYTKTELERLLSEYSIPIYSIGVGGNEAGLQYMFSLSRTTGASTFHVDKLEDNMEVSETIEEHYGTLQVKAKVPEELLDGSTRNSKLSVVTTNGTYEVQCQIKLPFLSEIQKEKPVAEITAEPTKAPEIIVEPTKEPEGTVIPADTPVIQEAAESNVSGMGIFIVAGGLITAVIVVVLICIVAGKKKSPKEMPAAQENSTPMVKTEIVPKNGEDEYPEDNGATRKLPGTNKGYRFQLTEVNDSAVMYRCNISGEKIKIGRKADVCNIVLTDKTISGEHCEVYVRSGRVFVNDVGSSNGTFVDGIKIDSEVEIRTGSTLKLGKTEYRVMIG